MKIDHVILGVEDLESAACRLEEQHGLRSIAGGSHADWGTANRIVPLGEEYLELLSVVDGDSQHPLAVALRVWCAGGDCLVGVAVETDDIEGAAARVGMPVVQGERVTPDGETIRFRLVGIEAAFTRSLPFFIEWGDGREHRMGPHRAPGFGIAWVELGGDEVRLREWLGEDVPGLRVVGGEPGVRAACLRTPRGEVLLGR